MKIIGVAGSPHNDRVTQRIQSHHKFYKLDLEYQLLQTAKTAFGFYQSDLIGKARYTEDPVLGLSPNRAAYMLARSIEANGIKYAQVMINRQRRILADSPHEYAGLVIGNIDAETADFLRGIEGNVVHLVKDNDFAIDYADGDLVIKTGGTEAELFWSVDKVVEVAYDAN